MYKLQILTNGIDENDLKFIKQGLSIIQSFIPNMTLTYKAVEAKFNSFPYKNDVMEGYLLDNSLMLPFMDSTYDNTFLFYDSKKVNPEPTNPSTMLIKKGNNIPSSISKQWYNGDQNAFIQFVLHELSHAEHFRKGVKDLTHDFYSSKFVQVAGTGLRDYYLYLLNKLNTVSGVTVSSTPTVTIIRQKSGKLQTLGTLYAKNGNKTFTCKTMELDWENNKRMVSCIPTGTYQVKKAMWWRKGRYFYQVQNVKDRSGIFIHEGNYYYNYEGCIGLGKAFVYINSDDQLDITDTKNTVAEFEKFMENKEFTLTIK